MDTATAAPRPCVSRRLAKRPRARNDPHRRIALPNLASRLENAKLKPDWRDDLRQEQPVQLRFSAELPTRSPAYAGWVARPPKRHRGLLAHPFDQDHTWQTAFHQLGEIRQIGAVV